MVRSMTGFAVEEQAVDGGMLHLQLRSVNHRHFELHLRLDERLHSFEPLIREKMAATIRRGSVECRAHFTASPDQLASADVDLVVLKNLRHLSQQLAQHLPECLPLAQADVLTWHGILKYPQVDQQTLQYNFMHLLDMCLHHLVEAKAREGGKLKTVIEQHLDNMQVQLAGIEPLLPQLVQLYQHKLQERVLEWVSAVDQERIAQELVLFAQKVDVAEEFARLNVHLDEVRRVLSGEGSIGKRLEFLMQEIHREVNTLGSKSGSVEITQAVVELKVLAEHIREQVQNIE